MVVQAVRPSSEIVEEILDRWWRTDGRHGAYLLRLRTQYGRISTATLATFSWDPVYSDGWRRFAWDTPPTAPGARPTLTLVGSPEVEIEPAVGADLPHVVVVRVQRADHVPQDGEPVRVGELLPLDASVFASQIPLDDPFATAQLAVPQTDVARVRHLPDGMVATHGDGNWEVRVTVDQRRGGAFGFELTPAPAGGIRLLTRSAFRMRVVRHGDVTVEYRQLTSRYPLRLGFGVHGNTSGVVDVDVGDDTSTAPIPLSGLGLDRARRFAPVKAIWRNPEWETTVTNVVLALVTSAPGVVGGLAGFTPLVVLGTVCDFGVPVYALVSGHDLAGTEVSTEQIVLMGVFALVGAAFDYPTKFLGLAKGALDLLFPAAPQSLVAAAMEAGMAQELARRTSPMVAEALGDLGEPDAVRLLGALEKAAASGAPDALRIVGAVLDEVLAPALARIAAIDAIPTPLFREAMAEVHVTRTAAYAALTAAERVIVDERYLKAIAAGDPGLLKLADVSAELAAEYTELIRDAVTGRLFNPALDGFRVGSFSNPAISSALGAGYDAYRLGKAAKGEVARDVVDWAYRQPQNSRYLPMLAATLGADFKALLRPIVQRNRYAVDELAATLYGLLAGDVDAYEVLRDLLTGQKVGALLQVDHILEQRFAHYFEGLLELGTGNFDSIVVPYNAIVVEGLKKFGIVTFPYTHALKTARLRHWIPYKSEGKFTVQEIYNAYRLVYEVEFGLGPQPFSGALEIIFKQFWDAVVEEAFGALELGIDVTEDIRLLDVMRKGGLDTTPLSPDQLLASVTAAKAR